MTETVVEEQVAVVRRFALFIVLPLIFIMMSTSVATAQTRDETVTFIFSNADAINGIYFNNDHPILHGFESRKIVEQDCIVKITGDVTEGLDVLNGPMSVSIDFNKLIEKSATMNQYHDLGGTGYKIDIDGEKNSVIIKAAGFAERSQYGGHGNILYFDRLSIDLGSRSDIKVDKSKMASAYKYLAIFTLRKQRLFDPCAGSALL
jgi:hypothetical protein